MAPHRIVSLLESKEYECAGKDGKMLKKRRWLYKDLKRRHVPLFLDKIGLRMVIQMDEDFPFGKDFKEPTKAQVKKFYNEKFQFFSSSSEVEEVLRISSEDFEQYVNDATQCNLCRDDITSLFTDIEDKGYQGVYPMFILPEDGTLRLHSEKLFCKILCNMFHTPGKMEKVQARLNELTKCKRLRCGLHSIDRDPEWERRRGLKTWDYTWELLDDACRKEIITIDFSVLKHKIQQHLVKYKFHPECERRVKQAYGLLVNREANEKSQPEFSSLIYEGVKVCRKTSRIHLLNDFDFIESLMEKALPEVWKCIRRGTNKCAESIPMAQDEVLMCLGICIYERLNFVQEHFCHAVHAWELMMCVGYVSMHRQFEIAVEIKSGVTKMDQFLLELSLEEEKKRNEEKLQQQRRESKRRQRKKKKNDQLTDDGIAHHHDDEFQLIDDSTDTLAVTADSNSLRLSLQKPINGNSLSDENSKPTISKSGILQMHEPSRSSSASRDCGYSSEYLHHNRSVANSEDSDDAFSDSTSNYDVDSTSPEHKMMSRDGVRSCQENSDDIQCSEPSTDSNNDNDDMSLLISIYEYNQRDIMEEEEEACPVVSPEDLQLIREASWREREKNIQQWNLNFSRLEFNFGNTKSNNHFRNMSRSWSQRHEVDKSTQSKDGFFSAKDNRPITINVKDEYCRSPGSKSRTVKVGQANRRYKGKNRK